MPRFVFASDSFKGSVSSARTAELLSEAALAAFPDAQVRAVPMADGGEGTVEAVVAAAGGELREAVVHGPLGAPVQAAYGMLDARRAIIEMAAASGLPLLRAQERDPLAAGTYGTGELILDALAQGAREITLAIGGSATTDGGMGCMRALGVRFLDARGQELEGCGADLSRVVRTDCSAMDAHISQTRFTVMCDVDNPLLGGRGAARVFAPQKGASPQDVERLEAGMANYARVLEGVFPGFDATAPGMGAAGGLGASASAFLKARMVPGIEAVLDLVGFDGILADCDLCVTGEGHADAQSAHGKVVSGVASRCRTAGVPCVALVGGMDAGAVELLDAGVDAIVPAVIDAVPVEEALAHAEQNYRLAAARLFSLVKIGAGMSRA